MLCLIYLIVILAAVSNCQESNVCGAKYITINSFETRDSFSVSCYGVKSDCDVYYSPPGAGCDNTLLTAVGTVSENETKVLTSDFVFGGTFCSENQIGVFKRDNDYDVLSAQLPGPLDAGKKFRVHIGYGNEDIPYQCAIFGLSLPAKVSLEIDDVKETVNVFRFGNYRFSFNVNTTNGTVVKAASDNPIVISCLSVPSAKLMVTFAPISSEPVFITAQYSNNVSVALSDCSTNELITDFSRAQLETGGYDKNCQHTVDGTGQVRVFTLSRCVLFVNPVDDGVCVSVMKQVQTKVLGEMGLPESRLSTRFTNNLFGLSTSQFFSLSLATCTVNPVSTTSSWPATFRLLWVDDDPSKQVSTRLLDNSFDEVSLITCDTPVLFVYHGGFRIQSFLSTYREDKFWLQYFDVECSVPRNLTPANTVSPTKAPSAGDRSRASWVVFLGFTILSVSLA